MSRQTANGETGTPAGISVSSISMAYPTRDGFVEALSSVDLNVRPGEFVSLVGPSGCGKSTLLNMMAGLLRPTAGTIRLDDVQMNGPSPDVGLVPQRPSLLPWRTVLGNLSIGPELRGVPSNQRDALAREWTTRVGLAGFESRFPGELSGGMRQRVNVARALLMEPRVLLMDEPFGSLDALTRGQLQTQLLQLWEKRPRTVIFVTHDLTEAIALSDRVVAMSSRPGRIRADVGVPIPRPRDVFRVHEAPGFESIYSEIWSHLSAEVTGVA